MKSPAVGKLGFVFLFILVIVLISDFFVAREHAEFTWDKVPGFNAAFGLFSSVVIIGISKFLAGFFGISKREDYYE
ncbi:MAG: hypothetical protein HY887_02300 [Deltaproteobacteria bacterium]|nr:hypothetical protein [Deltaproteobacteria bacterium]